MPVRATVDGIKRGRATLNELAERAGRDPRSIEVLAFGQPERFRTREEITDLEKAGVNHATIWLTAEGEGAVAEMEELARKVLG
jgi:hypothetical protein